MSNLELSGIILIVFAASGLVSYGLTYAFHGTGKSLKPLVGGTVRIKTARGVYRSKLLRHDRDGWVLSAPLSRDAYVPFRPGESVVLEAPVNGKSIVARTSILRRDGDTHEIVVANPRRTHAVERRETRRVSDPQGTAAVLEGRPALLLDFAPFGARLECSATVASGERIRLDVPWSSEPIFGWVLEVLPMENTQGRRTLCRISFEDRAQLPKIAAQPPMHLA